MASESQFYRLQKLGANEPLSTNGYAFTNRNIDVIDSLLNRMVHHVHDGSTSSQSDPTSPPTLSLVEGAGAIPAGTTVRYRITLVDQYGAESAASPEGTISTPPMIAAPQSPIPTITYNTGALLAGTYMYALTAYVNSTTQETNMAGSKAFITVVNAPAIVTLTLPPLPSGATGFNVYRRAPGESVYSHLATLDMSVATPPTNYIDNGSVSPNCNRQPPNQNRTNSNNSVQVTFPGATPVVPDGFTWKIYRTYVAGNYTNSLLHWVVEETSENSGITTTTYTDVGSGTTFGTPPASSEFTSNPEKIDLTDGAQVQGTLPPFWNDTTQVVTFAQSGVLEAGTGTFVWVCEYDEAEIQYVRCALGKYSTPASQDVIVDVQKYDGASATPTWSSIYPISFKPSVAVGQSFGTEAVPDVIKLVRGDALSIDIVQAGGGATPTDYDLTVNVVMMTRSGSPTTSYEWSP